MWMKMNNILKSLAFLVLCVTSALSACGQTKTQDYYMSHPNEIAVDLAECKQLGKSSFNCNEADKAAAMLKKN
jgi:hypothetical protein